MEYVKKQDGNVLIIERRGTGKIKKVIIWMVAHNVSYQTKKPILIFKYLGN